VKVRGAHSPTGPPLPDPLAGPVGALAACTVATVGGGPGPRGRTGSGWSRGRRRATEGGDRERAGQVGRDRGGRLGRANRRDDLSVVREPEPHGVAVQDRRLPAPQKAVLVSQAGDGQQALPLEHERVGVAGDVPELLASPQPRRGGGRQQPAPERAALDVAAAGAGHARPGAGRVAHTLDPGDEQRRRGGVHRYPEHVAPGGGHVEPDGRPDEQPHEPPQRRERHVEPGEQQVRQDQADDAEVDRERHPPRVVGEPVRLGDRGDRGERADATERGQRGRHQPGGDGEPALRGGQRRDGGPPARHGLDGTTVPGGRWDLAGLHGQPRPLSMASSAAS
jgi:hypothetical protein